MSIYYTTITERADYDGIVISSTPVTASATVGRTGPMQFRRVELDDSVGAYFCDYQLGRYRSFGELLLTEEEWERELSQGFLVLGSVPA